MRLIDVLRIDVAFENFPHPGQKARQLFSAEFVARTADHDVAVFTEIEMRVAKPQTSRLSASSGRSVGGGFRYDELRCFRGTQAVILSAPRNELKEKNAARLTRDFAICTLRRSFRNVLAPTPAHR